LLIKRPYKSFSGKAKVRTLVNCIILSFFKFNQKINIFSIEFIGNGQHIIR
jgi:hypothetical protein